MKFQSEFKHFHPRKCIWKCRLRKGGGGGAYCLGLNALVKEPLPSPVSGSSVCYMPFFLHGPIFLQHMAGCNRQHSYQVLTQPRFPLVAPNFKPCRNKWNLPFWLKKFSFELRPERGNHFNDFFLNYHTCLENSIRLISLISDKTKTKRKKTK